MYIRGGAAVKYRIKMLVGAVVYVFNSSLAHNVRTGVYMKEKKQKITLALTPSVWKRVQAEVKELNMSASALAEMMFKAGIERLKKEKRELFERLVG